MLIRKLLYRLGFFFLASYGLLYFCYKWEDPTRYNTDFVQYYGMVLHPFDFHAAPAPWVYRQWTSLIAHAFWRMHVFYPDQIQFHSSVYDTRIFFAVLLTNYLGVLGAAWVSSMIADEYLKRSERTSTVVPLLAGLLCFLSFYVEVTTITGQADGLSWLLVAVAYLFYTRRQFVPLALVLLLSILQREILPLIFLTFAAVAWATERNRPPRQRRWLAWVALWSAFCFSLYMLLRHIVHAPGNEEQSDAGSVFHHLLAFRPGRAYLMQVGMGQNLLMLLFGLWILLYLRQRYRSPNLLALPLCCGVLLAIACMANIQTNAARMVAMLTPIVAAEIAWAVYRLESGEQLQPAETDTVAT